MTIAQKVEQEMEFLWSSSMPTFIVGVSGGADSVCLLHALVSIKKRKNIDIHCIHVHHGIREEAADHDAAFVESLCFSMGLPYQCVHVDALRKAETEGLSIEESARILRYEALRKYASRFENTAIVLAHHQDDQAETVLLNILRGAGAQGLVGMDVWSEGLFRPLLNTSQKEIMDFLAAEDISFCTDETNNDVKYRRNALRKEIFPRIQTLFGIDPVDSFVRLSETMRLESSYMDIKTLAEYQLLDIQIKEGNNSITFYEKYRNVSVPCDSLSLQHPAILNRMILMLWDTFTGSRKNLEKVHILQIAELIRRNKTSSMLDLPGFRQARISYGRLYLEKKSEKAPSQPEWECAVFLPEIGEPNVVSIPARLDSHEKCMGFACVTIQLTIEKLTRNETLRRYSGKTKLPENGFVVLMDLTRVMTDYLSDGQADEMVGEQADEQAYGQADELVGEQADEQADEQANEQVDRQFDRQVGCLKIRNRRPGDLFFPYHAPGTKKLKEFFIDQKIPLDKRDNQILITNGSRVLWIPGVRSSNEVIVSEETQEIYVLSLEKDTHM